METKLGKEVRFLRIYTIVTTVCCAVFLFAAFTIQNQKQKFGEIDVERINIVEKNGKLRMVISNQELQHPGIVNGKVIERKAPRPPGMIFFNHLGDEMGGLVFGENGGTGHWGSLTFDKVRNDQTMGFRYLESDNGTYSSGLQMWQVPNIPSDVMLAKLEEANQITDEIKLTVDWIQPYHTFEVKTLSDGKDLVGRDYGGNEIWNPTKSANGDNLDGGEGVLLVCGGYV